MKLTPEIIKQIVCEEFQIDEFIVNHRQERERMPRHVFCYLLRKFTILGWREIGEMVQRDHSSAVYSYKLTNQTLKQDYKYGATVVECEKRCKEIVKEHLS